MSFDEEDHAQEFQREPQKRQRACDVCRRKKTRCDGSQIPGEKCTTCSEGKYECTYLLVAPKRPPPQRRYVESLEKRLAESEALVRQLRGELAALRAYNCSLKKSTEPGNDNSGSDPLSSMGPNERTAASLFLMRTALQKVFEPQPPPYEDDVVHLDLVRRLQKLEVAPLADNRFIGKSSGAVLLDVAMDLKEHVKREEREEGLRHGRTNDSAHDHSPPFSWPSRRLHFWTWKPLEKDTRCTPKYRTCICRFFIGQPSSGILLMGSIHAMTASRRPSYLCARWAVDPNITGLDLTCGREWFDQVAPVGNHFFGQASLYDLQYYSLAAQFLDGCSAPQARWNLVGLGLRAAQDIGCHRRTARIEVPTVERELYKRVFWVLVFQDRVLSSTMGRTCAVQYDDFDIDLPIECDDEYWEHPTHPFQQPTGVPSRVTFFNTLIRLHHIWAVSLKTLYGLDKSRMPFMQDEGWEDRAVVELDSALNNWRDHVPEHLRWDPTRADPVFFDQSVALHCGYFHLQTLIHRPFIPMIRKAAPTALPSLAICTNAARAIANMVDIRKSRKGNLADTHPLRTQETVFTAGLIMSLNVLSGKRTGLVSDTHGETATVHKCMEVLRFYENRWQSAGLFWDILAELASVGHLPPPNIHPPATEDTQPGSQISRVSRKEFDRTIDEPQPRALYEPTPKPSSVADDYGPSGSTPMAPSVLTPTYLTPTYTSETFPHPEAPYGQMDPAQASRELGDMMGSIDNHAIAMWTTAPTGLEVDDWAHYLSSFSDMQGQSGGGSSIYGDQRPF
ncbi:fungal-specific transcription factor domain-containing protein [Mycena polygramma]|nr:fungal-specific transcription factor domain-containing protein [Mycena polygramma]